MSTSLEKLSWDRAGGRREQTNRTRLCFVRTWESDRPIQAEWSAPFFSKPPFILPKVKIVLPV